MSREHLIAAIVERKGIEDPAAPGLVLLLPADLVESSGGRISREEVRESHEDVEKDLIGEEFRQTDSISP